MVSNGKDGHFPVKPGKNPLFQPSGAPGALGGHTAPPTRGPVDRGHPRLPHGTDSLGVHAAVRAPYTRDGALFGFHSPSCMGPSPMTVLKLSLSVVHGLAPRNDEQTGRGPDQHWCPTGKTAISPLNQVKIHFFNLRGPRGPLGGTVPPRHGAPWIGGTLGYPMAPTVGGCMQPFAPPILGTGPSHSETMSLRFRINYKDKDKFNTVYCTTIFTM